VIEQLEAERIEFTTELVKSKNQSTQAIGMRELAEEEANHLRSMLEATDCDKKLLQQQVQGLREVMKYVKEKTLKSMDELQAGLGLI